MFWGKVVFGHIHLPKMPTGCGHTDGDGEGHAGALGEGEGDGDAVGVGVGEPEGAITPELVLAVVMCSSRGALSSNSAPPQAKRVRSRADTVYFIRESFCGARRGRRLCTAEAMARCSSGG